MDAPTAAILLSCFLILIAFWLDSCCDLACKLYWCNLLLTTIFLSLNSSMLWINWSCSVNLIWAWTFLAGSSESLAADSPRNSFVQNVSRTSRISWRSLKRRKESSAECEYGLWVRFWSSKSCSSELIRACSENACSKSDWMISYVSSKLSPNS